MTEPAISVREVRKRYSSWQRKIEALKGVSIQVLPGEIVCVIGTNGSGKSTLIGAISGQVQIDGGVVEICGRDVSTLSSGELASYRCFLYQSPLRNLCPSFSIREMIEVYGFSMEMTSMREALSEISLTEERLVSTLSGGQQQVISMELVMARKPRVLLLDEPTASLDFENAVRLRRKVKEAAKVGIAVVLASHDFGEALFLADSLFFLHQGELVEQWAREELANFSEQELRVTLREKIGWN